MILSFNDNAEKFKDTGKKAYNLAKSIELGFNVQKYVCITKEDCQNNTITKSSLRRLRQILKEDFEPNTLYAVRVSPNLEGIDGLSFGEQFETYLNVSLDDLRAKIDSCLNLGQSKRIRSYIKRHSITQPLELNVMVQEMCQQDYAGVLYTTNPIGILSEKVITVGSGTCNDILEDKSTSNSYYFNADGNSYIVSNDDSHLLDSTTIDTLFSIGDALKGAFSKDVRLDFCVKDGKVYVLQVDTLDEPIDRVVTLHRTKDFLNDMSMYPLTNSFIKQCYESVFSSLLLHLTNSPELVKSNEDVIRHTLNIYNGRTFYNVNNLYSLFALIPFTDKLTPILEREFQVQYQEDLPDDVESNASNKLTYVLTMFKLLTSNSKNLKSMNDSFAEVEKIFNDCYCEELSDIQLKSLYRVIFSKTVSKWDIDIINSIYCYFYAYILKKFFKKDVDISTLEAHPNMDVEGGIAGTIQQRILDSLSHQEANRENQVRLYKYIEKIFMHMGTNLVQLGYIESQSDVYYLTVDELFNESIHSYKDLVAKRKALYQFYGSLPSYDMVTFNGKVLSKNAIRYGKVVVMGGKG